MNRAQVIQDLFACLSAVGPQNGHPLAPALVKRGIHLASELSPLPALTLFNEAVDTSDLAGRTAERRLVAHVWGAVNAAGGDYLPLDQLAAGVAAALADPGLNPHWQRTGLGRLEIYEGGAGDPLGLFDLEVIVTYEADLGVL